MYKQLRQLEQRRIKEQGEPTARVKNTGEKSHHNDNDISESTTTYKVSSTTSSEVKTENERPWYSRIKSWIKSWMNETTTQKKDEAKNQ